MAGPWAVHLILLLAQQLPAVAHQDATQFRSGVQLVRVDAVVSDDSGRPVGGLLVEDFELYEQGERVRIEFLRREQAISTQPAEAVDSPPHPITVNLTNVQPAASRVLALVLDADQIGFRPRLANRAREFGNLIVDGLGQGDHAAVITLGGQTNQQSNFTDDKTQLETAINRFRPTGGDMSGFRTSAEQFQQVAHAHRAIDILRRVVNVLAPVENRRKGIVLVSEGIPIDVLEPGAREGPFTSDLRRALEALVQEARRANVLLYTYHPGELRSPPTSGQRSLEWLSEQTGGLAAANTNTVVPEARRVLDDTGTYYVLGYYSTAPWDGHSRKIDVKVRRPGLRVRARFGYVSKPPTTSTNADEAIRAALPITDIPLRVAAVAVPDGGEAGAGIAVGIELDLRATAAADHEVVTLAADMRGDAKATDRLHIGNGIQSAGSSRERVRIVSHLRLRPGRYIVRVAVRRLTDGAVGTVSGQVDVPRFDRRRLAVGAIAVSERGDSHHEQPTDRRRLLDGIPMLSSHLAPDEDVDAILKIMIGGVKADHDALIDIVAHLTDATGDAKEIHRTSQAARPFNRPDGGTYRLRLPALQTGKYLLSVVISVPTGISERRTALLVVR